MPRPSVFLQASPQHSPKVAELDSAVLVQKDVLGLHVAVQDAVGVQVIESRDQLSSNSLDLQRQETLTLCPMAPPAGTTTVPLMVWLP